MLEFAYTVVEPNVSTQGIAVLANTLELDGGAIQSVSNAGENATLAMRDWGTTRTTRSTGRRNRTAARGVTPGTADHRR